MMTVEAPLAIDLRFHLQEVQEEAIGHLPRATVNTPYTMAKMLLFRLPFVSCKHLSGNSEIHHQPYKLFFSE